MKKNRFKSLEQIDRYGVRYVKNFTLWADGHISLQRWDTINHKVEHVRLMKGGE